MFSPLANYQSSSFNDDYIKHQSDIMTQQDLLFESQSLSSDSSLYAASSLKGSTPEIGNVADSSNEEDTTTSTIVLPYVNNPKNKTPKSYPCPHCAKIFSRPSALKTHTYTHTAEKPFQCLSPGCGRRFSVVSNLRRHFKIHQRPAHGGQQRITSEDRIRCVQQLIHKNNKIQTSEHPYNNKYDDSNYNSTKYYCSTNRPILPYGSALSNTNYEAASESIHNSKTYGQNHYLLLPPILSTNHNICNNNTTAAAADPNHFTTSNYKEEQVYHYQDNDYNNISAKNKEINTSESLLLLEYQLRRYWTNDNNDNNLQHGETVADYPSILSVSHQVTSNHNNSHNISIHHTSLSNYDSDLNFF